MRCIHQLRHRLEDRENRYGGTDPEEYPFETVADDAWDLQGLHALRQGDEVYRAALELFPETPRADSATLGGIDEKTRAWLDANLKNPKPGTDILGAGILDDGRFYRAPHLQFERDGTLTLTLIKAGMKLKERYLQQADWIRSGFSRIGTRIHLVRILHPSRYYVRGNEFDAHAYFEQESVTRDLKGLRRSAEDLAVRIRTKLDRTRTVSEDNLCSFPETCPFCGSVYRNVLHARNGASPAPEVQSIDSVAGPVDDGIDQLFRAGPAYRLLQAEGIERICDLESASPEAKRYLKPRHWVQYRAFKGSCVHIDAPVIDAWFAGLEWPLFFIDFESTSAAIPRFEGIRPWEHIPFAYSLCRADSFDDAVSSNGYIVPPGGDGRLEIGKRLVEELGDHGTILVYGKNLELSSLAHLAENFPEIAGSIGRIVERVKDVQQLFADFSYYHPAQGAKISLKTIVPILTSGPAYRDLAVQNGAHASFGYYFLSNPEQAADISWYRRPDDTVFLESLTEYSRLDTEGLFRIVRNLYRFRSRC